MTNIQVKFTTIKKELFEEKIEYKIIHSTEKPYSCYFEILEKYPALSEDELQNKIDEECKNTFD